MTGNDVINEALLLINVIYPGQTISAEALATSKLTFNMMLGEWSAQQLAVFSVIKLAALSLVSGTADYTIGSGATFNVARPERIEAWSVIDASGAANGGKPVDALTFTSKADDRTLQGARIEMLNYDPAFPTGTIHLYPKPTGGTLELWVWQQFTDISDFTAAITFPPGYLKALVTNLAVDLADRFGRPVTQSLAKAAAESKSALGSTNQADHAA